MAGERLGDEKEKRVVDHGEVAQREHAVVGEIRPQARGPEEHPDENREVEGIARGDGRLAKRHAEQRGRGAGEQGGFGWEQGELG